MKQKTEIILSLYAALTCPAASTDSKSVGRANNPMGIDTSMQRHH